MADNRFWQDASGQLTFEMFRVAIADYPSLCKAIKTTFSLSPDSSSFGAGLDQVFQEYRQGECVVELAWDNWIGFTVVAKTTGSESLVREIAEWLLQSRWSKTGEPADPGAPDRPRD